MALERRGKKSILRQEGGHFYQLKNHRGKKKGEGKGSPGERQKGGLIVI